MKHSRIRQRITSRTVCFLAALLLVLMIPVFTGCGGDEAADQDTAVEEEIAETEAPEDDGVVDLHDFSATDFEGGTFTQEDLAEADLTVLNFWATWCPYCIDEMPELAAMEQQLPENVQMITYCDDGVEETDEAIRLLEETGFEGTSLYGGAGDITDLIATLEGFPTTVFLDSEGNQVLDPIVGSPEDIGETYRKAINQALTDMGKGMIGP